MGAMSAIPTQAAIPFTASLVSSRAQASRQSEVRSWPDSCLSSSGRARPIRPRPCRSRPPGRRFGWSSQLQPLALRGSLRPKRAHVSFLGRRLLWLLGLQPCNRARRGYPRTSSILLASSTRRLHSSSMDVSAAAILSLTASDSSPKRRSSSRVKSVISPSLLPSSRPA